MHLMRIGLTAMMTAVLSMGIACAQEPVDPQPAKPLTYVHPSYHKVTPDVAKKMIEVNGENDDYVISGYICYPEMAKASRNVMTTLVNGRVIRNQELNRTILDSYHTYIPKEKYPIVVLNIDVDPILIDINIHPQKMDIKFSKMDSLKELVSKMIKEQLKKLLLIPHASVRDRETVYEVEDSLPVEPPKSILEELYDKEIVKFKRNHEFGERISDEEILAMVKYQIKYLLSNNQLGKILNISKRNYSARLQKLLPNYPDLQKKHDLLTNMLEDKFFDSLRK